MDKSLFRSIKGLRPVTLLLGLLSLLQAAAMIGQAWWLATAITALFRGHNGNDVDSVASSLLLFFLAFAARQTIAWMIRRVSGRFAEATSEELQRSLLQHILALGPEYAARQGSGNLVTLAIDGVVRFRTYLERFIPRTLDMVLITIPLLVTVYALDVISGLILTFTLPILVGFFILLGTAARATANKQWRSYQVLSRHFTDALRGLETLRFLGRSRSYATTVSRVSDRYRGATMRTLRVAFLSSFALDFFSTLSVAFVAVGLGLRLIDGNIDLQPALAVLLLAPDYFLPVRMLGTDYHASLDGKEAWQSIREIMERDASSDRKQLASEDKVSLSLDGKLAEIELDQVTMAGDDTSDVNRLGNLSLKLDPNVSKVGIVGASGAGKSSLLQLLSGFVEPSSGSIRINGQPLQHEFQQAWQRQIAYIPQHPHLFSATLADNVRFYEPQATDDEVIEALRIAGLEQLLHILPNGIHERIGEGGRSLSGGQASRVALARALVGGRSVLLLDEPTAHLDIETEWEVKEAMLPLFTDRRVFLATHRLHWMKEMDWVLVLQDGRLVEQGTHEQLIAIQGVYWSMLEASVSPSHHSEQEVQDR